MAQEFAVFSLAESQFALGVSHVREVLRAAAMSPSPGRTGLEGLFNLRGEVIPVVDLRAKLDLSVCEIEATDFFIVFGNNSQAAALRTDRAVQLETVGESCVESSARDDLIVGTIRIHDRVVSLLSAEALLELTA